MNWWVALAPKEEASDMRFDGLLLNKLLREKTDSKKAKAPASAWTALRSEMALFFALVKRRLNEGKNGEMSEPAWYSDATECIEMAGLRQLVERSPAAMDAARKRRRAMSAHRLWTTDDGFTLSGAKKSHRN